MEGRNRAFYAAPGRAAKAVIKNILFGTGKQTAVKNSGFLLAHPLLKCCNTFLADNNFISAGWFYFQ